MDLTSADEEERQLERIAQLRKEDEVVSGELQHELRRAEDLLESTRAAFLALSKDRLSGAPQAYAVMLS